MIFAAFAFKHSLRGILRTAEPIAVDLVAAGIVTYAAATEVRALLRTK